MGLREGPEVGPQRRGGEGEADEGALRRGRGVWSGGIPEWKGMQVWDADCASAARAWGSWDPGTGSGGGAWDAEVAGVRGGGVRGVESSDGERRGGIRWSVWSGVEGRECERVRKGADGRSREGASRKLEPGWDLVPRLAGTVDGEKGQVF